MNYGTIKNYDIANGTGVRVSLFVSGCRHHCKGCFNSETWDFNYGNPYTKEVEAEILEALKPAYIQGFSLLGGEPFEPENQKYLYDVDLIPGGKVYTEYTDKMLACIDTLVDGEFIEAEKDLTLEFRGSRNQRILHLNEMRKNAKN